MGPDGASGDGAIRVDRAPRGVPDRAAPDRTIGHPGPPAAVAHPVDADRVREVCDGLQEAAERGLRGRPAAEIAGTLDRVSRRWLDPGLGVRRDTVAAIAARLGWSEASVAWSLDREMETSLATDLLAALEEEIRPAAALDGWVTAGDRERRAFGPRLVAGVASGNIPGLPHLTVMRALLVKAPVVVKVARDEPLFLGRYVDTLRLEDPALADCVAVQAWPGGDTAVEGALLSRADCLVAYGGDEALAHLARRVPPGVRTLWHGHRTGACLVSREAAHDPDLPAALAEDAAAHEQEACLCPAWVFVEGDDDAVRGLASRVDEALERLAVERPPPRRSAADLGARRNWLDGRLVEDLERPGALLASHAGPALSHLVVAVKGLPRHPAPPRGRVVVLHVVADLGVAVGFLGRRPQALQVASLACPGPRGAAVADALAAAGVTRICAPGRMGRPDMRWRHDGRACLEHMVRWVERPRPAH